MGIHEHYDELFNENEEQKEYIAMLEAQIEEMNQARRDAETARKGLAYENSVILRTNHQALDILKRIQGEHFLESVPDVETLIQEAQKVLEESIGPGHYSMEVKFFFGLNVVIAHIYRDNVRSATLSIPRMSGIDTESTKNLLLNHLLNELPKFLIGQVSDEQE